MKKLLFVVLLMSLVGNAYLFSLVVKWQDAWLEQLFATSILERLYDASSADVSFDAIDKIAKNEFGDYRITSVMNSDVDLVGYDPEVIEIEGVRLFFKDGNYIGSKANVPDDIQHWGFGGEF